MGAPQEVQNFVESGISAPQDLHNAIIIFLSRYLQANYSTLFMNYQEVFYRICIFFGNIMKFMSILSKKYCKIEFKRKRKLSQF